MEYSAPTVRKVVGAFVVDGEKYKDSEFNKYMVDI